MVDILVLLLGTPKTCYHLFIFSIWFCTLVGPLKPGIPRINNRGTLAMKFPAN